MTKAWSLKDLAGMGPMALAQLRAKGILPEEAPYKTHERISFLQGVVSDKGTEIGTFPDSIWCGYLLETWETDKKEVWVKYEIPFPDDKNVTIVTRLKNIIIYTD